LWVDWNFPGLVERERGTARLWRGGAWVIGRGELEKAVWVRVWQGWELLVNLLFDFESSSLIYGMVVMLVEGLQVKEGWSTAWSGLGQSRVAS
jgi:hypothetical protein